MEQHTNYNQAVEKPAMPAAPQKSQLPGSMGDDADRRLKEEINILKLEGALFCFDPREAKRRRGTFTLADALGRPLSIDINPNYGQPSVTAYKVLQAAFLKLVEQGCDATEDGRCFYDALVHFGSRELTRLVGRKWGTPASEQLYQAIMQLRRTGIQVYFFDKETGEWTLQDISVFSDALFSGHGKTLSRCSLRLHSSIVTSINKRHTVTFNLQRLNTLDTLGLVIYKRIFFHFSNLMHESKPKGALRFTKDYEAICKEWLGGLTTLRYRSDILKDQLGPHLEGLLATGLIRRYSLEKNKAGDGFNLTVYPGKGFFEDYALYYQDGKQPRPRARQVAELAEVKSLELVAYFHRQLGRTDRVRFEDHETAYADELLATHSEEEIRNLIEYALAEASKTKFDVRMLFFGALKRYLPDWAADQGRKNELRRQAETVDQCPFCNEAGFLELKQQGSNRMMVHPCPHQLEGVTRIEDRLQAFRA